MQVRNDNSDIRTVRETMEVDDTVTSAYVKINGGETLKKCSNGEYKSLRTGDRYIPVVVCKSGTENTEKGFINITQQEEREYDRYGSDERESAGLFGRFKRR